MVNKDNCEETRLMVEATPSQLIQRIRDSLRDILRHDIDFHWRSPENWKLFEEKLATVFLSVHQMEGIISHDRKGKIVREIIVTEMLDNRQKMKRKTDD